MNRIEQVGKSVKIPSHERAAAEIEISRTFIETGNGDYNFRESGSLAFVDRGNGVIESQNDSPSVADAMVRLMDSRGVESFKLSGTDAFMENTEFAVGQIQADYDAKHPAEKEMEGYALDNHNASIGEQSRQDKEIADYEYLNHSGNEGYAAPPTQADTDWTNEIKATLKQQRDREDESIKEDYKHLEPLTESDRDERIMRDAFTPAEAADVERYTRLAEKTEWMEDYEAREYARNVTAPSAEENIDRRMELAMAEVERPPVSTMSPDEAARYEQMAASVEPEDGYNDAMTLDDVRHMANLQMASSKDVQAAAFDAMGDSRSAADVRAEAAEIREADAASVPQFTRIDDDEEPQRKAAQQANQQAIQQDQVKAEASVIEDTSTDEDRSAEVDDAETKRRTDLARKVANAYTVNGSHYLLKGDNPKEAFHDKGKSISVKEQDERTVQDAVDLMSSRGAKSMKVSGTAVFKRLAWIAGQKHGMDVAGYKPTDQDIAAFQKQKAENVITDTTPQWKQSEQQTTAKQSVQQSSESQAATPINLSQSAAPIRQPVKGELSGKLLDYGDAPYQHDSKKKLSYFVKVEQPNGKVREQWGVNLKSAVIDSGVQKDDQITLRKTGAKDVMTTDENQEEIVGRRADWVIDSPERERLNKEAALRSAAAAVATKFDRPEDQQAVKSGMDQRIASQNGPLPDVMIRKQVNQARPVQREKEQLQQTV